MYKQLDSQDPTVKNKISAAESEFCKLEINPTGNCWTASNGFTIVHDGNGKINATRQVICPYCGNHASLVYKKDICKTLPTHKEDMLVWNCSPCNAYTSVHKHSTKKYRPMGVLATANLRSLRYRAHRYLDKLWEGRDIKARQKAYKVVQDLFNMTEKEAHISNLTEEQCIQLISFLHRATASLL